MYLHRLRLRAIGPYADEYEIDFATLGASGIFLLEGPTGSGKSTIIDAIVFALYGGLAGSASSDDRMTSHHAAPEVEPFVELDFETGAGLFRVRRSPARTRPKTRGTGTTKVNQSVSLLRLSSPDAVTGEPISTRAQEVGAEIADIIGLNREQFLQTVVLPQGEFARFLGATGEERKKVLESLFGTGVYERTTEILGALRREAQAAVAGATAAVNESLAGLRGAVGDDELGIDDAASAVEAFAAAAQSAVEGRDAARARRDSAAAALDAAMTLSEALSRRAHLRARRAALDDATADIEARRVRLDEARRASTVVSALASHRAAERAAVEASARVEAVHGAHADEAALVDSELSTDRESLVAELATLAAVARTEAALPSREAGLKRAVAAADDALRALAGDEESLEQRQSDRNSLDAALAAATSGAGGLDLAVRDVAEQTERLAALRRRYELVIAHEEAERQVAAAAAAARASLAAENDLRRRRIDGMAGELAVGLVDGSPCAVCGALDHPAPAVLVAEHPGDDDIERASEARAADEQALHSLREESTALAARLADLAEQLGDASIDTVEGALGAARERVREAEAAALSLAAARSDLARFDEATAALERRVQAARISTASESARLTAERGALAVDTAEVRGILDGRAASCAALIADLERRRAAVTEIIAAREAHARAVLDETSRAEGLAEALVAAGFGTALEAASAAVDRAELVELEASVSRHDRDAAVVAEGLASPDVRALTGDESVDVDATRTAADVAAADYDARADEAARALDLSARAARAADALAAAIRASDGVAEESKAVVRMADVTAASGPENLHGVTLGTYVLLRRFDDVVAAANTRLAVMSSGRYLLEASDSKESGSRSRKTGLALAIRDNATDTTRDPKSFSGGETFYASLSLALGLADVVQAEAGGVSLGTLFVDEGFGTLDPETLDSVLSELGRLSAAGRVVGIVSHVEDLKQRVADRIEVRRRPDGSSVLRSTAGV